MASMVMGESERHAPPSVHLPIPEGALESVSISLERSGCFGTCPSYKVTVRGDGIGSYRGDGYVTVHGEHGFRVDPQAVQCLVENFRATDFWSLDAEYVAPISDLPGYKLTLTVGGHSKSLYDYAGQAVGMPAAVTGLEDAIDAAANIETWTIGTAATIAALDAERFRFRSRAGGEMLAEAVERAPDDMVLALLARHTPLDAVRQGFGTTRGPAEIAAAHGNLPVLRALIAAGAFPRGAPDAASAALRASVGSRNPEVIAEILKHHPDVNARDREGNTALMLILVGGHFNAASDDDATEHDIAIARQLVRAGADPNVRNREGRTVLHEVIEADLARALIALGAKLEVRDKEGDTPLLATFDEDTAVVLIEASGDPLARSKDGTSFLDLARAKKWAKALAAAERRGAR